MKVTVKNDEEAVAERAADVLAEVVGERPEAVLGLPTGETVLPLYAELRRRHADARVDLSLARAFNLDELVLPPEHPASFASYMERHAWEEIGLDRSRCDIPRGFGDLEGECRRYDRALDDAGPLDLLLLGVGTDGHVAYNLPGPPAGGTHVVELADELASSLEVPLEWRPLRAVTIGLDPMHSARRVLLLATGTAKVEAIRILLHGPRTEQWPCTLLRAHPGLEVILDRELADAVEAEAGDGEG